MAQGYKIAQVDILDQELSPEKLKGEGGGGDKTYILDLRAVIHRRVKGQLLDKKIINIEMQTVSHKDFSNRSLAYVGRLYSEQLKEGEDYGELIPVISVIFIMENLPKFKGAKEKYYHHCCLQEIGPPHAIFSKGIQFVIVELSKFMKTVEELSNLSDCWYYLFKNAGRVRFGHH